MQQIQDETIVVAEPVLASESEPSYGDPMLPTAPPQQDEAGFDDDSVEQVSLDESSDGEAKDEKPVEPFRQPMDLSVGRRPIRTQPKPWDEQPRRYDRRGDLRMNREFRLFLDRERRVAQPRREQDQQQMPSVDPSAWEQVPAN